MILTLTIQIGAILLLTASILLLYSLLKPRRVGGKLTITGMIDPTRLVLSEPIAMTGKLTIGGFLDPTPLVLSDPTVKVWQPNSNVLRATIARRGEVIECYRRPTSSHWFRYDNHIALPTPESNLLNREARRLEQSN
ncbi:hypothetical protein LCGC14_2868460 [marine sediment metagenome]|uniref:Uncharacterized protein n=1 Tax=marine sediment metagenome TaxID=412755 RepID=A0A0F8Y3I5_9ZZZZ